MSRIIELQKKVGTKPDGDWGQKSRDACKAYLRSLMPKPNPWPRNDAPSLRAFYGEPGNESNLVSIPVDGLGVEYFGKPVTRIHCHKKVADSLLAIIRELSKTEIGRKALKLYAGCFNVKKINKSTSWSLHSFGAAIDLMPDTNKEYDHWPIQSDMPLEIMEVFARHGWKSGGAFWGRDAMHYEASS